MLDNKKPIRIGIIGCGWAGGTLHLPALQSLPDTEVTALADIDPETLNQVADRFHIDSRSTDYREVTGNKEIDVIAVCVPASSHTEIALVALDKGKHVFIEKPLALRLDEIDSLIEKTIGSSKKITVGFNLRSHRLVRKAREMIRDGTLGEIFSIRSQWTSDVRQYRDMPEWRNKREEGGGTIMEIGIHHFDLWRFLLGSEVEEVFAITRSSEWEDQIAAVNARMKNGAIATSIFSELTSNNNEIEIHGKKGSLKISCYRFDGLEFQPLLTLSGSISSRVRNAISTFKNLPEAVSTSRKRGEFMASYAAEWEYFIQAIRNDGEVVCNLEEGRLAVQIALAAAHSASIGKPVKLADAPREITLSNP